MSTDSAPMGNGGGTEIGSAVSAGWPADVLRGKGWRFRRIVLVLALFAAALAEIYYSHHPTAPYSAAPAACRVSTPPHQLSPLSSSQALKAAIISYHALQVCFGGPRGTFRAPFEGMASAWPESQALAALLGLAATSGAPRTLKTVISKKMGVLEFYWTANGGYHPSGLWPSGGRGVTKFDDNAWLGLDLVKAFQITDRSYYLTQAEAVAAFEKTGWSNNPNFAFPGGIFWQEPAYGSHRNAVSTDGAALLNARLYALTGIKTYLKDAEKYLHWSVSALTLSNGLIGDQISETGVVTHKAWSYNQGLVISVYTSLYRSTKKPAYLAAAELLAEKSLSYLTSRKRLEKQPPVFDAIYFRSLARLDSIEPDKDFVKALQDYATYLYSEMNSSTGVIHSGPLTTGSKSWLLTQAAATQVFTLYAATSSHAVSA